MRYFVMYILTLIAISYPITSLGQDGSSAPDVRDMVLAEDLDDVPEDATPSQQEEALPSEADVETEEGTDKMNEAPKADVESAPPPRPALPTAGTDRGETAITKQLTRMISPEFWLFVFRCSIALIIMLLTVFVARVAEGLSLRFLNRTQIAARFVAFFGLEFLFNDEDGKNSVERRAASIIYYVLIAAAVVLCLQVIGFDYSPFEDIVNKVQRTAWNGIAALIWLMLAFAGGRTLQGITTRLFDSFDVDRRIRELVGNLPTAKYVGFAYSRGRGSDRARANVRRKCWESCFLAGYASGSCSRLRIARGWFDR